MENRGDLDYPSDAQRLVDLAREKRVLLVCAESCTCGSLARNLCVPGASDVLAGGFVCYSNEMKMAHLGVSPKTISSHTEVSHACAQEMAEGAVSGAQLAHTGHAGFLGIATTGYVGPNASHAYIAISPSWGDTQSDQLFFNSDCRSANTRDVVRLALHNALQILREK